MKTLIEVTPNRERGYDATVYSVRTVRLSSFMRNLGASNRDLEPLHTVNAPSEAKARELAQGWIDAQPKAKRAKRVLSDGELESMEAARNEERAYGSPDDSDPEDSRTHSLAYREQTRDEELPRMDRAEDY